MIMYLTTENYNVHAHVLAGTSVPNEIVRNLLRQKLKKKKRKKNTEVASIDDK